MTETTEPLPTTSVNFVGIAGAGIFGIMIAVIFWHLVDALEIVGRGEAFPVRGVLAVIAAAGVFTLVVMNVVAFIRGRRGR